MRVPASRLVRKNVEDTFRDYADFFEEMQVHPDAQETVFELIRQFRDKMYYLRRIKTDSKAAHKYLNNRFFGSAAMIKLGKIEMLSSPLKSLINMDTKDEAVARVTPAFNRLWSRMRDKIFDDSRDAAYCEEKRMKETKQPATRSIRTRSAPTPCTPPSAADQTATPSPPALLRPPMSKTYSETYNAETARLLKAVLGSSISRKNVPVTVSAPENPVSRPTANAPHCSTQPESRAGPGNPDVAVASSDTHGTSGIDRAWDVVEGMMKKNKRRASHDGDGGEFLLVYSSGG